MSFFKKIVKVAAPVIGSAFGPAGAAAGSAVAGAVAGDKKGNKWLDAATGVGNYLRGMKETTQGGSVEGYAGLPKDVQDFMMQILFPQIKGLATAPRPTGMMRQYTDEEANDPIFGSKALSYMQGRKNQEVAPAIIAALTKQATPATTTPATNPALSNTETNRLKSLGLI
jgi:hypothetical protein